MNKIRNGIEGELTAEIFETWFPDKPEVILMDFLQTEQDELVCIAKLSYVDIGVTKITKEYAEKLLKEFKILRGQK